MHFSLNFILLIIVFVYLLYSFIKTKQERKTVVKPKEPVLEKSATDLEKLVVTAVIAAIMDKKKYVVKRVYPEGLIDEKKSLWKFSGRLEKMNTRFF